MPVSAIDLTGLRFGRLIVLGRGEPRPQARQSVWRYRCDCGVERSTTRNSLVQGARSCGCLTREINNQRAPHGESRTRLNRVWRDMRARCRNPQRPNFHNYGGRGIMICPEWETYPAFRTWALASGYRDDLTIERSDCNGNYEPQNCTWVPRSEQPRNTRLVLRAPDGRLWGDIAREHGIKRATFGSRKRCGWAIERAATAPLNSRREA